MSLVPAKLTSLDMYRDGGSVSACFQREGRNWYTLMLKIIMEWADRRCSDYRDPVLEELRPNDYTSPTTGVTIPNYENLLHPLTWSEAAAILDELEPQVDDLRDALESDQKSEYRWVFPALRYVVETKGTSDARGLYWK